MLKKSIKYYEKYLIIIGIYLRNIGSVYCEKNILNKINIFKILLKSSANINKREVVFI